MKGYTLASAVADFQTVDEGLAWLGDGGLLFVWSDVPGILLHADIYIVAGGNVRVTLYDTQNDVAGAFHFTTAGHALGFARSYVVGSRQ